MDHTGDSLADQSSGSNTPKKPKVVKKPVSGKKVHTQSPMEEAPASAPSISPRPSEESEKPQKEAVLGLNQNAQEGPVQLREEVEEDKGNSSRMPKSELEQNADRRMFRMVNPKKKVTNPEVAARTLYVNNVPANLEKKVILQHFEKYGCIESIKIRGLVSVNPMMPKWVAAARNLLRPRGRSVFCYIRFKNQEDCLKALVENGNVFEGHHLTVYRCGQNDKLDETKAVFIGNLSFEAEDEELWELFKDCGPIMYVKVMRDRQTMLSKGCAYINFKDSDSVQRALEMENVQLRGRKLWISLLNSDVAMKNGDSGDKKQITEPGKPKNMRWRNGGNMVYGGPIWQRNFHSPWYRYGYGGPVRQREDFLHFHSPWYRYAYGGPLWGQRNGFPGFRPPYKYFPKFGPKKGGWSNMGNKRGNVSSHTDAMPVQKMEENQNSQPLDNKIKLEKVDEVSMQPSEENQHSQVINKKNKRKMLEEGPVQQSEEYQDSQFVDNKKKRRKVDEAPVQQNEQYQDSQVVNKKKKPKKVNEVPVQQSEEYQDTQVENKKKKRNKIGAVTVQQSNEYRGTQIINKKMKLKKVDEAPVQQNAEYQDSQVVNKKKKPKKVDKVPVQQNKEYQGSQVVKKKKNRKNIGAITVKKVNEALMQQNGEYQDSQVIKKKKQVGNFNVDKIPNQNIKEYQGSRFTDKKKKRKINKGLLEKKKQIKKIAPKQNIVWF